MRKIAEPGRDDDGRHDDGSDDTGGGEDGGAGETLGDCMVLLGRDAGDVGY
jgi:hypothetical protein